MTEVESRSGEGRGGGTTAFQTATRKGGSLHGRGGYYGLNGAAQWTLALIRLQSDTDAADGRNAGVERQLDGVTRQEVDEGVTGVAIESGEPHDASGNHRAVLAKEVDQRRVGNNEVKIAVTAEGQVDTSVTYVGAFRVARATFLAAAALVSVARFAALVSVARFAALVSVARFAALVSVTPFAA